MKKIAIYGKGGIGKSTVVTNLSAALAESGHRVMQIGCDPKSDSTVGLTGGNQIPTVLQQILEKRENTALTDLVFPGDFGVACVEAGGPKPGMGCAGRGIISAFEKLNELHADEVRCAGRCCLRRICLADSAGIRTMGLYCHLWRKDVALCGRKYSRGDTLL